MNNLPTPIQNYLQTLNEKHQINAYLCLNNNLVVASTGSVGKYNFDNLDSSKSIEQSVPFLEGLLPASNKCNCTTIIDNVHIDDRDYFDIHIFHDDFASWLLFFDTTQTGQQLQEEQQKRLDIDLDSDRCETGS